MIYKVLDKNFAYCIPYTISKINYLLNRKMELFISYDSNFKTYEKIKYNSEVYYWGFKDLYGRFMSLKIVFYDDHARLYADKVNNELDINEMMEIIKKIEEEYFKLLLI